MPIPIQEPIILPFFFLSLVVRSTFLELVDKRRVLKRRKPLLFIISHLSGNLIQENFFKGFITNKLVHGALSDYLSLFDDRNLVTELLSYIKNMG